MKESPNFVVGSKVFFLDGTEATIKKFYANGNFITDQPGSLQFCVEDDERAICVRRHGVHSKQVTLYADTPTTVAMLE